MADAKVYDLFEDLGSASSTLSPLHAEVMDFFADLGRITFARAGSDPIQIGPQGEGDTGYFASEAALLAYPTDNLKEGDWAKIAGSDAESQTRYGAIWNGLSWTIGQEYEQGLVKSGSAQINRVEITEEDKAEIRFVTGDENYGWAKGTVRALELLAPSNSVDTIGKVEIKSATTASNNARVIITPVVELAEQTTVATPSANSLRVYVKDKSGTSALYAKDDAGTEHELTGAAPASFVRSLAAVVGAANVAASLTAINMVTVGQGGSTIAGRFVMPWAGALVGISTSANEARVAGTCTVEAYLNGVATGLTAVLDGTNTTHKSTTQAMTADVFAAGDYLEIKITTTATWLPITADVSAQAWVQWTA